MKNSLIVIGLVVLLWLWFPTGDPSDVLAIPIIRGLGLQNYLVYSAVILLLAYVLIPGRNLGEKFNTAKNSITGLWR